MDLVLVQRENDTDTNICINTVNPDSLSEKTSIEINQISEKSHQHLIDKYKDTYLNTSDIPLSIESDCNTSPENMEKKQKVIISNENVDSSLNVDINQSMDSKEMANVRIETFPLKNKVRKKIYLAPVESDSDEDILPSLTDYEEISTDTTQKSSIFCDSEETVDVGIYTGNDLPDRNRRQKKRRLLIDSDSEIESDIIQPDEKSFTADDVHAELPISTTDSKSELIPEKQHSHGQKSNWSSLCDEESSEDEITGETNEEVVENSEEDSLNENKIKPLKYKRKSRQNNGEEEPKRMTAKKAAQLWKETKSESQRMVRESNVSLPYHKPKSFTLQEFLSRRPKLASAVPIAATTSPSVAIKMCTEQLEIISKKMEERQKELKQFYKSDSESEGDEGDKGYISSQEHKKMDEEKKDDSEKVNENTQIILDSQKNDNLQKENEENVGDSGIDTQEIVSSLIEETKMKSTHIDVAVKTNEKFENHASVESNTDSILTTKETKMDISGNEEIFQVSGKKPVEQSSLNFDFNLDDLDDNFETEEFTSEVSDKNEGKNEDKGSITEEAENKENMTVETKEFKKISKLELLKEGMASIKPRLSGGPNHVIDLATGIAKPNEVTKLMERFVQHTAKRNHHKTNKVKLSVVSIDDGEIHKETVAINVVEDDLYTIEEKPGAKLAKLRDSLQNQMAQRRSDLWQKKNNKDSAKGEDEEKSECGADDNILDDDEEEEMSESSEDEELEEDDETKAPIIKKKSAFIDEEADVSEVDELEIENENDDGDEKYDDDEKDEDEEFDQDGVHEKENEENIDSDEKSKDSVLDYKNVDEPIKRTLKRIIKRFSEESDDEDEDNPSLDTAQVKNDDSKRRSFEVKMTKDEDEITCHQPQNNGTPIKNTFTDNKSVEFLTPISYITGIQNLSNSTSKLSPFRVPTVPSPLKDSNWHSDLQKKLFENSEITNSQAEAMAELCSGNFPDSQELEYSQSTSLPMTVSVLETEEIPCSVLPSTQELLGICSGKFSGFSQVSESVNDIDTLKDSQKSNVEHLTFNTSNEIKTLGEDQGMIISQLLDEEEMEKFKRKLQTPIMTNTQRRIVEEFEEECGATGGVIDSDDEDALEVKKKKQKKLYFSDDENSESEVDEKEEEIDLHDEIEDDEEQDVSVDNIGYDSEENEIELMDENRTHKLKPSDFFEKEAELSESEWGSDDEDEKDLDTLEAELGDTETFDEKKLKNDLEKIHLRRMLADDNKEVKLLQELLLEDGELHGAGRERQFKWKNIDSMNEVGDNQLIKEDDVYLDEEESEEQWRRKRHEREMFLKEKMMESSLKNDNDLLGSSQLLKISHKVIQKRQQSSQGSNSGETVEANDRIDSPTVKCGFSFMSKRGSFLSRSDQVLQRLAEYNKFTTMVAIGTAKSSRNFLFQTVSASEQSSDSKDKKRKANDGTPNVIKKLRLSDTLSPALERKVPRKPRAKAKLFGNSKTE